MKRRSFLAFLGFIPFLTTKAEASEVLQDGAMTTNVLEQNYISGSWSCPEFANIKDKSNMIVEILDRDELPSWLQVKIPEFTNTVFVSKYEDKIVNALWWKR